MVYFVGLFLALPLVLYLAYWLFKRVFNPSTEQIDIRSFPRKFSTTTETSDFYDVVIVGAGPSGSTAAYYLAKAGKKVLLLEKKKFPRDKICGDAVCKTAIEILDEMGIYDDLVKQDKALVADHGGFVSPGGFSYIGHSHEQLGKIPAAIACKRLILDEAIAKAAERTGAELKENSAAKNATFDHSSGLWTVIVENSDAVYKGRVLVCADGAPSKMATYLGLVSQPPQGSCSRSYIESGTHMFKADGVVFYNKGLLPGYAALFKHPGNEVNYCCYIIPGNPKVTNDDLSYWHHYLLSDDPNVSRAVGNHAEMERMRAGPLRFGGEQLTYGDHVLVVGDAAGFIDPMTGEGIHTAMDSGCIAAKFLCEAFEVGNFDKEVMKEYQNRWLKAWGHDFKWSTAICQFLYRYPIVLDAATAAVVRKGDKFLAHWADIMTGRVAKVNLLRPEFVITIGFELMLLLFKKVFFGGYQKSVQSSQTKKRQ